MPRRGAGGGFDRGTGQPRGAAPGWHYRLRTQPSGHGARAHRARGARQVQRPQHPRLGTGVWGECAVGAEVVGSRCLITEDDLFLA